REEQNASFIEGKAVHCFTELTDILEYVPAGWESEEGDDEEDADVDAAAAEEEIDAADLPDIDEAEEEALKGDTSLKWDDDEDDYDNEKSSDKDEEETDEDETPPRSSRRRR